jgi:hypothetical protein
MNLSSSELGGRETQLQMLPLHLKKNNFNIVTGPIKKHASGTNTVHSISLNDKKSKIIHKKPNARCKYFGNPCYESIKFLYDRAFDFF